MKFKVGDMFYNKDRDYIATIESISNDLLVYRWARTDRKTLYGYLSNDGGLRKVKPYEFEKFVAAKAFTFLTPLEKELV